MQLHIFIDYIFKCIISRYIWIYYIHLCTLYIQNTHIHVYLCIDICTCIYECICVDMYVNTKVCANAYIYI